MPFSARVPLLTVDAVNDKPALDAIPSRAPGVGPLIALKVVCSHDICKQSRKS